MQKDKSIFKLEELPVQRYAESLGLPGAPKIKFLNKELAKQKKNASHAVANAETTKQLTKPDESEGESVTESTRVSRRSSKQHSKEEFSEERTIKRKPKKSTKPSDEESDTEEKVTLRRHSKSERKSSLLEEEQVTLSEIRLPKRRVKPTYHVEEGVEEEFHIRKKEEPRKKERNDTRYPRCGLTTIGLRTAIPRILRPNDLHDNPGTILPLHVPPCLLSPVHEICRALHQQAMPAANAEKTECVRPRIERPLTLTNRRREVHHLDQARPHQLLGSQHSREDKGGGGGERTRGRSDSRMGADSIPASRSRASGSPPQRPARG